MAFLDRGGQAAGISGVEEGWDQLHHLRPNPTVPDSSSLYWDAWICSNNFTGSKLSSSRGVAGVQHGVREKYYVTHWPACIHILCELLSISI